jgi:hypothetical protein
MTKLFHLTLIALFAMSITACAKIEERSLPYNYLAEVDANPVVIDTVIITFSSPAFKSFRVEFHPNLDSLNAEQRSAVTGYRLYENNVEQASMPLTQKYFIRLDQPKGKILKWELVLIGDGGESKRSRVYEYKVP